MGLGFHLTVFTYDTGHRTRWSQGLGLAYPPPCPLPSSPGLEGGGQEPTPIDTLFSAGGGGGTWPLAPCGLGLHIHKPRNSLKTVSFKTKQNKKVKSKKGKSQNKKQGSGLRPVAGALCPHASYAQIQSLLGCPKGGSRKGWGRPERGNLGGGGNWLIQNK